MEQREINKLNPETAFVFLIGTSTYEKKAGEDSYLDLPKVSVNIAELKNIFERTLKIPDKNIKVYLDKSSSEFSKITDDITDTIEKYNNKLEYLFIYFSGHGEYPSIGNDERYLTLCDADTKHYFGSKSIRVQGNLINECLNTYSNNTILIFDACNIGVDFKTPANKNYLILSASYNNKTASTISDHEFTAYTGKIIQTVKNGLPNNNPYLTLNDINKEVYSYFQLNRGKYNLPTSLDKNILGSISICPNPQASPENLAYDYFSEINFEEARNSLKAFLSGNEKVGIFSLHGYEENVNWLLNLLIKEIKNYDEPKIINSSTWNWLQDKLMKELYKVNNMNAILKLVNDQLKNKNVIYIIKNPVNLLLKDHNTGKSQLELIYENFISKFESIPSNGYKVIIFFLQNGLCSQKKLYEVKKELPGSVVLSADKKPDHDDLQNWIARDFHLNLVRLFSQCENKKEIKQFLTLPKKSEPCKLFMNSHFNDCESFFDFLKKLMCMFEIEFYEYEEQWLTYRY